jgi:hypothetical protein
VCRCSEVSGQQYSGLRLCATVRSVTDRCSVFTGKDKSGLRL